MTTLLAKMSSVYRGYLNAVRDGLPRDIAWIGVFIVMMTEELLGLEFELEIGWIETSA
ncbi:hypothetical protein O5282_26920 [Escherichia coli]|nr:hypothetical protein [Escherichia coli]